MLVPSITSRKAKSEMRLPIYSGMSKEMAEREEEIIHMPPIGEVQGLAI